MVLTEKRANNPRSSLPWRKRVRLWCVGRGDGPWVRRVHWRRIGGVGALGVVGSYALLVLLAFWFVRSERKLDTVGLADLALPWRWGNYRVARGEQHLANARRLAAEGKFREALVYARAGVAQSPDNRDGRLLLVDLLLGTRWLPFARQTLLEGLNRHGHDPKYLHRVVMFLLQQQEDAEVVALATRLLTKLPADGEAARVLAMGAATACYFRGNYDQAEDFLHRAARLGESRDGRLLRAKMENDRGYRELALLELRQLAAEWPHDAEIHRELVSQLRLRGLTDEARRSSLAFQIAHPSQPGPRIELLQAYRDAGDHARVEREADALLRDIGSDSEALLALAEFAANAGDVPLVRRAASQIGSGHPDNDPYAFLAAEAAIVAGDYQGALASVRAAVAEKTDWSGNYPALFDSLQAIAQLGLGDVSNARPFLTKFLAQRNLRAENLLLVANRLAALNGNELARQTLLRAVEVDPENQAALARLIEFDLILNRVDDLPSHVHRFVAMRRPSPEILRVVQHKLGSDLFLFSPEKPAALEAVRVALINTTHAGDRR